MGDYNVLLIFQKNLERLSRTFMAIRASQPAILFLFQDGPKNAEEKARIEACRDFVENHLDWPCTVYRNYQTEDIGVWTALYKALKWAFSIVDKCIFLEDDDVCSPDFFPFCWHLLNKYENDERIGRVSGTNSLEDFPPKNYPYDYFFARGCPSWGWGTWKRVVDQWDEDYSWLDDENKLKLLKQAYSKKKFHSVIDNASYFRKQNLKNYELMFGVNEILYHQLAIIPSKNLISNIGAYGGSHSGKAKKSPYPKIANLYFKEAARIEFPLKEPNYVVSDQEYDKAYERLLNLSLPYKLFYRFLNVFKN